MKLILSGVIENISTRNDGSVKFTIGTQEMGAKDAGDLFQLRNKYVKCLLSDTNISDVQAALVDSEQMADTRKQKSPSQRLRGVMFRVHEAKKIPQDFDKWYASEIERFIEGFKEILNQDL